MSALTKIFIVLMLVCSLVGAVIVVAMAKSQQNYRDMVVALQGTNASSAAALAKTTNDLTAANAENSKLTLLLNTKAGESARLIQEARQKQADAEIARDAANAKIATAENKASQLAASVDSLSKQIAELRAENGRMGPDIVKLTSQNAELARANNELLTSNRFAEQSIRKLQEEIARLEASAPKGGATGASDAGTVASLSIQAPAQINGRVVDVKATAGHTLIELPLGTRDGVRKGTQFVVSRGGNFVSDAVVETVTPDASVAATKNTKQGEAVKVGDIVTSGNPQ